MRTLVALLVMIVPSIGPGTGVQDARTGATESHLSNIRQLTFHRRLEMTHQRARVVRVVRVVRERFERSEQ